MNELAALKNLTKKEKLIIIEALWEDLSQEDQDIESPQWHEKALGETKARLKAGEEEVLDWIEAKRMLREQSE